MKAENKLLLVGGVGLLVDFVFVVVFFYLDIWYWDGYIRCDIPYSYFLANYCGVVAEVGIVMFWMLIGFLIGILCVTKLNSKELMEKNEK